MSNVLPQSTKKRKQTNNMSDINEQQQQHQGENNNNNSNNNNSNNTGREGGSNQRYFFLLNIPVLVTVQEPVEITDENGRPTERQEMRGTQFLFYPQIFLPRFDEQQFMNHLFQMYQQEQKNLSTDIKQLNQLPVYTIHSNSRYQQEFGDCKRDCNICLSTSEDGERWVMLPCGHAFHEECLKPWLEKNNTCPVCRYELEMADAELEQERKVRMNQEYGPEILALASLCTKIQNLYSEYQKCVANVEQPSISKLNQIDADLNVHLYQLDTIVIPDESQQQSLPKYKWDWNRIRQVRRQLIQRVQLLQSMIEETRKKVLNNVCNQPQAPSAA